MDVISYVVEILSVVLAIVALIESIVTSKKQATLETRLALFDKRFGLIHKISHENSVERIDIEMAFPKCVNLFNDMISKRSVMRSAEVDISEYFDYLSHSEHISKHDLKMEFQLAEINAEETADDSFDKFCKAHEIKYASYPGADYETRNYIALSDTLNAASRDYEEAKKTLIDAMLSEMK